MILLLALGRALFYVPSEMWHSLRLYSTYGRYSIHITSIYAGIKSNFCSNFRNWFNIACSLLEHFSVYFSHLVSGWEDISL